MIELCQSSTSSSLHNSRLSAAKLAKNIVLTMRVVRLEECDERRLPSAVGHVT
jgi:hypothetical protein